ncbi:MAG: transposase [Bacilli bacterium]|nr:transposase [Bacilli bacterium]
MAYGNKIKDNEMNLIYKYYGNFTAKENYIFRQLVFNSSMIYNKVNWYFLKNGFNSKLQPQIVRKLSYEDQNGKYFTTQECAKIVDSLINDWKSFFAAIKEYKKNPKKFTGKPRRPKCQKVKDKMNEVIFDASTIWGLKGAKNNKTEVIKNNKISFSLSKKAKRRFKMKNLEVNLSNFKFPKGLNKNLSNLQQVRICYDKKIEKFYLAFIYRIEVSVLDTTNNDDIMAIDLGQNNLITGVFNKSSYRFILDGKELKSKIAYVNSRISKLQSKEMKKLKNNENFKLTKKMKKLYKYWKNYSWTYIHKCSSRTIKIALENNCNTIVIGDFKGIKRNKKHMKYFVTIPYVTLIDQIKYKAKRSGIKVIMVNESYTSGCSCIDDYIISKKCYNKKRRKKRGNFVTNNDFNINADVNGAYNILRKYLKNNIPHCLIKDTYKNLYLTYLNMYLRFKGNSAVTGGLNRIIYSPVLIHL